MIGILYDVPTAPYGSHVVGEGFPVNSKDWKAKIHLFVNDTLYCNITF